ncbi:MAG: flagellar type III secretion system pore protein FliP [Bacillota bacterium]|nr:flagellar type III secretion system pore protein FliP [Bacillota bacterium]
MTGVSKAGRRGIFILAGALALWTAQALAAPAPVVPVPRISFSIDAAARPQDVAVSLQIIFLLTVLSLAPSILVLMTAFTRIVVVLSFVRTALSLQQIPPTQVLIGLSLFLTYFVMAPTWQAINDQALQPYLKGEITQVEALQRAEVPLKAFLLKETREKDLELFVQMARLPRPANKEAVPLYVAIPAFVISELKTAFEIGFTIFLPFLVIDMIVASTLMSMGMLMLPPVMISLPFKILLFVLVDGWHLVVRSLLLSFH